MFHTVVANDAAKNSPIDCVGISKGENYILVYQFLHYLCLPSLPLFLSIWSDASLANAKEDDKIADAPAKARCLLVGMRNAYMARLPAPERAPESVPGADSGSMPKP